MFKNKLALINKNWDKREMTAKFWLLKADELQSKESWKKAETFRAKKAETYISTRKGRKHYIKKLGKRFRNWKFKHP